VAALLGHAAHEQLDLRRVRARIIRAEACPVTVIRFNPMMPRNVVWSL